MKVAIRVDSSTAIGSGHLMRCLTLAVRMRKENSAEVHFISRDLEGNLHEKIREIGFFVHVLPRHLKDESLEGYAAWLTVSQDVDAVETKAVFRVIGKVNRLVVDNYAIDIEWEREMRPFVDEIFVIDDLANRSHDCDVLLDQNIYLDKGNRYRDLVPETCKLLLGPQYALLREEFYEARKHLRKRDRRIRHILVFYGGSDLTNETMKALRAVYLFREMHPQLLVDVVVGASNPHKDEIKAYCTALDANAWMTYHCQVDNMAELMTRADLMLGAGGSTMWERCLLELPSIVTAVAENQVEVCKACAAEGIIIYLGRAEEVSRETILNAIQQIQKELFSGAINVRIPVAAR